MAARPERPYVEAAFAEDVVSLHAAVLVARANDRHSQRLARHRSEFTVQKKSIKGLKLRREGERGGLV